MRKVHVSATFSSGAGAFMRSNVWSLTECRASSEAVSGKSSLDDDSSTEFRVQDLVPTPELVLHFNEAETALCKALLLLRRMQ